MLSHVSGEGVTLNREEDRKEKIWVEPAEDEAVRVGCSLFYWCLWGAILFKSQTTETIRLKEGHLTSC